MPTRKLIIAGLLGLIFFGYSCQTYYKKTRKFNAAFAQGKPVKAIEHLNAKEKWPKKRMRFLHWVNLGTAHFMAGHYDTSNTYFEKAYRMIEGEKKNNLELAASLLTNPKVTTYRGEVHEILYINYYKSLNYIFQGEYSKALVEVRRMNIQLAELSTKFSNENKFQQDAFIQLMMGLIYDAQGQSNDAFIAYRNAYKTYDEYYSEKFGIQPPEQLKKDIIRTAYQSGFPEEVSYYQRQFGIEYKDIQENQKEASVLFLWHNGLAPFKSEFSVNFYVVRGQGGEAFFVNESLGLRIPWVNYSDNQSNSGIGDLEFVRLAMPKYIERPPVYTNAKVFYNQSSHRLEIAEPVHDIAKKTLKDRLLEDLGFALGRLALKKASEYALREESDEAGAALSLFNAITEQADTRNWQSLPFEIGYTRIPVEPGEVNLRLQTSSNSTQEEFILNRTVRAGEQKFVFFHTLASRSEDFYVDDFNLTTAN